MKKLEFEINGEKVQGIAEMIGSVLWLNVQGRTYTFEPPIKENRRGRQQKTAGNGEVLAPMPGKVIKVSVAVGEAVSSGQVLLVLEAMKMEYTLKAPGGGKVAGINCTAGQQVTLGQNLLKLDLTQGET